MIRRTKAVYTRPNTSVKFRDIAGMVGMDQELIQRKIHKNMSFSEDWLTRTMVIEFDLAEDESYKQMMERHKDAREADHRRRVANGIHVTYTEDIVEKYTDIPTNRGPNRRILKLITTRPNTNVLFHDHANSVGFNNEYHDLPVDVDVTFSEDFLTRTRVSSYDLKYEPIINELKERFKHELDTEYQRQVRDGITNTMYDITDENNPIKLF